MKRFTIFLLLFFIANTSPIFANDDDAKEGAIKTIFDEESELGEGNESEDEDDSDDDSEDLEDDDEIIPDQKRKKDEVEKERKKDVKSEEAKEAKKQPDSKKTLITAPTFSHRMVSSVMMDDDYQSTNRKNENTNLTGDIKLFSEALVGEHFFARSYLRLNESKQSSETTRRDQLPNGGGDRTFENMGVRMEELTFGYRSNNVTALAGKFLLNFGNAWRWNKSIWLNRVAGENYRESEKLGFTTFLKAGDSKKTGRYHFGFASFTNDRKNLDNAVITNRDSDAKSDAKPGDTRSFGSYLLSLDVNFDFEPQEKLIYHFAILDMAVNNRASSVTPTKTDSQKSFVAGMNYQFPLTQNLLIDSLIEYADKRNAGGDSDVGEKYFTAAISGKLYQHWYSTLGLSTLSNSEVDAYGFSKNVAEISAGYEFGKNDFFDKLVIQFGYKNQRSNYRTSLQTDNVWGGLVRMTKTF